VIRYVLPVPPLCSPFLCLSPVRSPLLSFFTVCSSSVEVPIVLHSQTLSLSLSLSTDPSYNNLLLFFALIPSACSWASRIRYCACGCVNHFENCRQSEVRLQLAILLASFFSQSFLLRLKSLLQCDLRRFKNDSERDCESVLLTPPIFIRFVSVTGRSKLAAGSHCCSEITGQRVNGEKGWSDQRSSIGSGDQQRLRQLFSLPLLGGNASRHSTGPEIPAPAEKTVTVFTP